MTTTGEYLLSKSTLSSGTALQHLLAQQGGSAAERVVYCSQGTVVAERWEISVSRPVKKAQPVDEPAIVQQPAPRKGKKALEVFVTRGVARRVATVRNSENVFAQRKMTRSVVAIQHGFGRFVVTRRPGG